jgi:N-acetylglucosamine-6-phosphate deacetylase
MHRHDNIIQRVLSLSDRLWIMFIADGAHVPFFALANYLQIVGLERAIVVTDAIAAAGMGQGKFTIGGVEAVVGEDLVPRAAHSPQQFAGSGLTMPRAAENLRTHLRLSDEDVTRLLAGNPRQALALNRS